MIPRWYFVFVGWLSQVIFLCEKAWSTKDKSLQTICIGRFKGFLYYEGSWLMKKKHQFSHHSFMRTNSLMILEKKLKLLILFFSKKWYWWIVTVPDFNKTHGHDEISIRMLKNVVHPSADGYKLFTSLV